MRLKLNIGNDIDMAVYKVWKGLGYESLEKKFDAKINIQLIIFWSNDSIRYDEDRDIGNF